MANQPKTPIRGFRIPDELYARAQAEAARNGDTLTDVVRNALEEYAEGVNTPRRGGVHTPTVGE